MTTPNPPSKIGLTFETTIMDMQRMLNQELDGLLYEDDSFDNNEGDNVMIKAWKTGDIITTMEENAISYKVPIRLWLKARINVLGATDYREVNGEIELHFKSALTLANDWSFTTQTEVVDYEWTTAPTVGIAGMDVSIKMVADMILKRQIHKIASSIDKTVGEKFDLKAQIDKAWEVLKKPIIINKDFALKLNLKPVEVATTPIMSSAGIFKHRVNIFTHINANVGDKTETVKQEPLPELTISNDFEDGIDLRIVTLLTYDEINRLAEAFVKDRTFKKGFVFVRVKSVKVLGDENEIIARLEVKGSVNGEFYISGKPVYDPKTSVLKIENPNYDVHTRNVLVRTADFLYSAGFRDLMSDYLEWPMDAYLRYIKMQVNKKIRSYSLREGIDMHGKLDYAQVEAINLVPEGLQPVILAKGDIKVTMG